MVFCIVASALKYCSFFCVYFTYFTDIYTILCRTISCLLWHLHSSAKVFWHGYGAVKPWLFLIDGCAEYVAPTSVHFGVMVFITKNNLTKWNSLFSLHTFAKHSDKLTNRRPMFTAVLLRIGFHTGPDLWGTFLNIWILIRSYCTKKYVKDNVYNYGMKCSNLVKKLFAKKL